MAMRFFPVPASIAEFPEKSPYQFDIHKPIYIIGDKNTLIR